jgi:hypothetical protein
LAVERAACYYEAAFRDKRSLQWRKAMSWLLPEQVTEKLVQRANERLEEAEKHYGSADEFITEDSRGEILDYCARRIQDNLAVVKKGKGDATALLADCLNHLRFIAAKLELTDGEAAPAQEASGEDA